MKFGSKKCGCGRCSLEKIKSTKVKKCIDPHCDINIILTCDNNKCFKNSFCSDFFNGKDDGKYDNI